MKKLLLPVAFAVFALTSCGGGDVDADAQKMCDLTKKSMDAAKAGNAEEAQKLSDELKKFGEEIQEKYKSDADAQVTIAKKVMECSGLGN